MSHDNQRKESNFISYIPDSSLLSVANFARVCLGGDKENNYIDTISLFLDNSFLIGEELYSLGEFNQTPVFPWMKDIPINDTLYLSQNNVNRWDNYLSENNSEKNIDIIAANSINTILSQLRGETQYENQFSYYHIPSQKEMRQHGWASKDTKNIKTLEKIVNEKPGMIFTPPEKSDDYTLFYLENIA